jgi:hypothetical protein
MQLSSLIFPVISVLVASTMYAACIKLSARLLRYDGIKWRQGVVCGLILVICTALIRAGLFIKRQELPLLSSMVLGSLTSFLIGGWFFSTKCKTSEGGVLGWNRAMNLSGLTTLMSGVTGALLLTLAKVLTCLTKP